MSQKTVGQKSTVIAEPGFTILDAVEEILDFSDGPLGPKEIAERGIEVGLFQVPRFRTKSYLTQIIQSSLHDNAAYSPWPRFRRPKKGKYSLIY